MLHDALADWLADTIAGGEAVIEIVMIAERLGECLGIATGLSHANRMRGRADDAASPMSATRPNTRRRRDVNDRDKERPHVAEGNGETAAP